MERTISMMVGKGSLNHNNRTFAAKNVDAERSKCNQVYAKESIKKVYHEFFDEALKAYNAKQSWADRRIDNYYEKIRTSKQEKLFHELVVQIGNRDDTNCDMLESVYAQSALKAQGFVGTHEKHLSVYDYEKKMRKAEVAELEQEISDQKDKIAGQSFLMEVNEETLQSQEQILEENEAKAEEIRQETEKAKEDWEKVQIDKDRVQDSYVFYQKMAKSAKESYELYHSWCEEKQKSYEDYAEKNGVLAEKTNALEEQRKSDRVGEVQAEEIKLDIVKMQLQEAVDDFENVQKQAMQQYEKYRRVELSERGTAMFDDMLQLKRENMILKDENRTLKEKLQKAYDFMKQFTINGLNMLERFLESVGERVHSFSENIGFGGRSR